MRRGKHYVGRRAMEIQGSRRRGRPKRRWLARVRGDIKDKGWSGEEVYDCAAWRRVSSNIDPNKSGNKMKKKKNRSKRL